jgi:hypothetical protein
MPITDPADPAPADWPTDQPQAPDTFAYPDLTGRSGVQSVEIGEDHIIVHFHRGRSYRYDHHRPGAAHVRAMKALAETGVGLATYISRHVKDHYAARW